MPQFDTVLIFGATGEVGSAAALEASRLGAKVYLGMRDTTKENKWLTAEQEKQGNMSRIKADLTNPASLTSAVVESGAESAYIYAVHSQDHMRSALAALKNAGIQHIVFLSTVSLRVAGKVEGDIRSIGPDHFIPYQHAQVEVALEELDIPHTAVRAGFFASNPLRIYLDTSTSPPQVKLLCPEVLHDCIDPQDLGRSSAAVLTNPKESAAKAGAAEPNKPASKDIIYLNGPALLSQNKQWEIIGRALAEAGKPDVKVIEITKEEYLTALAARFVPKPVAESLAKSMEDTTALYAAKEYDVNKHNVRKLTGSDATTFAEFVNRELSRYFK